MPAAKTWCGVLGLVASSAAASTTDVYVYDNYFDDPTTSIGSYAIQRVVDADGAFVLHHLDATDVSEPLAALAYDGAGTAIGGLNDGVTNASLLWFWSSTPDLGETAEFVRRTRRFGAGRGGPPEIVEKMFEVTYVRDEILPILGERLRCHVVREEPIGVEGTYDVKWFDDAGMLVRRVHVVGGETRTTLLARREENAR